MATDDALAVANPTVYDVANYGAQGDGTTDDTNAIQAAIDAANARGGGTIVFPGGTFRITRSLTIYSRILFRGAGMRVSIIKKAPQATAYPIIKSPGYDPPVGDGTHIHSWSLQNISLDGNREGGALGNGIQTYGSGFSMFNVTIYGCEGRGIWSAFHADEAPNGLPLEAQLLNVWVHHCTSGGIYWDGPKDSQWVNMAVYLCGPADITSGSTTRGVEAVGRSHGLRVTNGHVWGLNHAVGWYLACDGPGLVNCLGEGAEQAQVVVVGNGTVIAGGKYFAARPDRQTVGIEIGDVTAQNPTAGSFINTFIINCEKGSLKFTNDAGIGRYTLTIWQTAGQAVVVGPDHHMRRTNVMDIQITGGAKAGDFAEVKPVTFQEEALARRSLEVQGDLRAGSVTSKIGFFGAQPQARSSGWVVANLPDTRTLHTAGDLNEVRAVLATLLRELDRYGLITNPTQRTSS